MFEARSRIVKFAVAPLAAALLLAGCASDGDSESISAPTAVAEGMVNVSTTDIGAPFSGGTLTFGSYAEPASLDPAKTIAAVTTGGVEMVNIYDSLMRLDAESDEIVPQLAASLVPDSDFRNWTLTLREGVTFSNGMPLDSAAVKASQERYASKPAPEAGLWKGSVVKIETPDANTVTYELNKSWSDFPGILTSGPGMIVAAESDGADGKFTPIGAGPFTFGEWRQGESMLINARAGYWAGTPNLKAVQFLYLPSTQVGKETFINGGIDATFVREPIEIDEMMELGTSGYISTTAAGNAAIINATAGRAGSDPRVRRAMALAVDPAVINERAFGNPDIGDSSIFPSYSRWRTETSGPAPDVAEAASLVSEAKADGYDGKLKVVDGIDPASQQIVLAAEAQLEAVGFDVQVEQLPTIGDQIRVIAADRDYDLAGWGLSFRESDPLPKLFAAMHSSGKQTYGMYTSPAMDALIEQFQIASDLSTKQDLMDKIQQQVNTDVPFLSYGALADFIVWDKDVHGVLGSSSAMVLFGDAWKS